MTTARHRLYRCRVMHKRLFPLQYRFSYTLFSLLLDVDHIDELVARIPFFSRNRFNLLSFHDRDHGARDGSDLRRWLTALLIEHGVEVNPARILLLSMPRVAGYAFNPLSLFYCLDEGGELLAIVCEVKNTFGEQHCYVLHQQGRTLQQPVSMTREKKFHVSPFMAIEGSYDFRLWLPQDTLSVCIRHLTAQGPQLIAAQRGTARPVTAMNLFRALARTPLMTLKVITMIHWHALKIWVAKAPLYNKPPAPMQESS